MQEKKKILLSLIILFCCNNKINHNKTQYIQKKSGQKKNHLTIKRNKKKLSKLPYSKKISILLDQIKNSRNKIVRGNSNHIFGLKKLKNTSKIDLSYFNRILELDTTNNTITVESSVTIKQILEFLGKYGYILPVIPDMSHLVIGGIISGVGGGSASFKNGCFHDNMLECDVILGNGTIKKCSPQKNSELFYSVPNTLGTIGYITRVKLKIIKSKPYVSTTNLHFKDSNKFFNALEKFQKDRDIDFLDGTIFSDNLFVIVIGKLMDKPTKKLDNFINEKIYWKCIQTEKNHCFKLLNYIYRWDTDLYYTSMDKAIPNWINKPKVRRIFPKWSIKFVKKTLSKFIKVDASRIVQDILIPFSNMRKFYNWYKENIKLYPIYICPGESPTNKFKFWKKDIVCDFGIGYGVKSIDEENKTRSIEDKMIKLGGRKLLYSRHQMSKSDFWKIYDKDLYDKIRKKYDSISKFPDLYEKIKK